MLPVTSMHPGASERFMGNQDVPENIALSCSAHCGPGARSAAPDGVEHALKQAPLTGRC